MSKPCFINKTIMLLFMAETLTKRTTKHNDSLILFRMYKEATDLETIGFVVKIDNKKYQKGAEYRWHDTFNEAYKFYHNYDIDLNKQEQL